MGHITGIGGIFFKCRDVETTKAWYEKHLGMAPGEYGINFPFREDEAPEKRGYSVWGPFKEDTEYFGPSELPFMVNLRVRDLDALLTELAEKGIEQVGEMETYEYGKFAWVIDPNGIKIELWEQIGDAPEA